MEKPATASAENPFRHLLALIDEKLAAVKSVEDVRAGIDAMPRTGWVRRGVENPESVGLHTDEMKALGREVAAEIPELDVDRLVNILEVHDWPEFVTGDIITSDLPEEERRRMKAHKYEVELAVMERLCARLDGGAELLELWHEYESGTSPEADIARQLDKLQVVAKAVEYQDLGQPSTPRDFYNSSRPFVTHPVLLQRLGELEKRIK